MVNLLPPYFISHSGKDKEILEGVLESFDFYNRTHNLVPEKKRPYVIMTKDVLSASQQPNWLQVKNEIERSEALILVLSQGVTNFEYTQNWVAFEVGVAAACEPPKPVIAIQGHNIRIPIPYVTHYYSYSNTLPPSNFDKPEEWQGQFNLLIYTLLGKPDYKPEHPMINCPMCKTSYHYHGPELIIKCPCCPCIIQKQRTPDAEQQLTYESWVREGMR